MAYQWTIDYQLIHIPTLRSEHSEFWAHRESLSRSRAVVMAVVVGWWLGGWGSEDEGGCHSRPTLELPANRWHALAPSWSWSLPSSRAPEQALRSLTFLDRPPHPLLLVFSFDSLPPCFTLLPCAYTQTRTRLISHSETGK